ncbi:hypothetical protein CcI49_15000 [Frankia sp. CcI49]|uniref:hypothetical protein n=1 Tax=Frankia sp. CcI49 TaxID=1745382 RepID=UPI00097889A1|nr:hypothetical protein [Frankia sp. CcI49]ONH60005.1 hypothetical protein CcI49_15000 [Frankia sp. CcI49]
MAVRLDFYAWRRSTVFETVAAPALTPAGRLTGRVPLTLHNTERPGDTATESVVFDLLGPGDVGGLKPAAVRRAVPAPGSTEAENTKCAYVEFSAPDLPWRYTPRLAAGRQLAPWLVLVVGTPEEIVPQPGGTVAISASALAAHRLVESPRWAHVQDDVDHPGQRLVSRLLSPRPLAGNTAHRAVIVPAFTPNGTPAWADGSPGVTVTLLYSWEFTTAPAGDFPTLAARLRPHSGDATLGRVALAYPLPPSPGPGPEAPIVRGALAPLDSVDVDIPVEIGDDLETIAAPVLDPAADARRPVVSLPVYGDAWVADPTLALWSAQFRRDPRHRAVAGLGAKAGIDEQDKIVDAAVAQAGALAAASERIRALTAGLAAASALWNRRLPQDRVRRLVVFGPALRGMQTQTGTVLDRATGGARPLPPAIFSAAARRVLRPGPARTRHAADGATDPRAVLEVANRCAEPPPRAPDGLPHSDHLSDVVGVRNLDKVLRAAAGTGRVPVRRLRDLVGAFDRSPYSASTVGFFEQVMRQILDRVEAGRPIPLFDVLTVLEPRDGRPLPEQDLLIALRALLSERPDDEYDTPVLDDLVIEVLTERPDRPCDPVDLDRLADAVADAVDPTAHHPVVVDRVLDTIDGLDDQPLTPPELSPDLDIPAWQLLRDHDPDWLLPGAGTMPVDRVVAVTTNPVFVDSYLLGLNTQILGELRFRNIAVRAGSTPLRQFWSRAAPDGESFLDDIHGVHLWPTGSALGSGTHQPPAAAGADLVIVARTPLFRRYPHTVVYLTPAPLAGGEPDWDAAPDLAQRIIPSFQGSITPEIVFFGFDLDPALGGQHWVVFEEPPHGVQFFSGPHEGLSPARRHVYTDPLLHLDGAEFADAAYADPYRVMVRGSSLIPGAL